MNTAAKALYGATLAAGLLLPGPAYAADVVHFPSTAIDAGCFSARLQDYAQWREGVTFFGLYHTELGVSRLTEVVVNPGLAGKDEEQAIRKIAERCEIKTRNP